MVGEISLQELYAIIGEKEVQIRILRKRIAALEKQLAEKEEED